MAEKCPHCGIEMEPREHPSFGVVGFKHDIVACGLSQIEEPEELKEIWASDSDGSDPGKGNYDFGKEEQIRALAELVGFYAESGPTYDPSGRYLCGSCRMRLADDGCTHVEGHISMQTGSCQMWARGSELGEDFSPGEKFAKDEVNYGERPDGFGCYPRCGHASEAAAADPDGRNVWCNFWKMHVRPNACCVAESGPDLKE